MVGAATSTSDCGVRRHIGFQTSFSARYSRPGRIFSQRACQYGVFIHYLGLFPELPPRTSAVRGSHRRPVWQPYRARSHCTGRAFFTDILFSLGIISIVAVALNDLILPRFLKDAPPCSDQIERQKNISAKERFPRLYPRWWAFLITDPKAIKPLGGKVGLKANHAGSFSSKSN
jgi:hypothetical protein